VLSNGIRLVAILAVLGGIGLGAYVWGLSLVPEVVQFSSPSEPIVESNELGFQPAALASVVPAEATTSKENLDEELATQSVTALTSAESGKFAIEATPLVSKKEKPKLEPLPTAKPVPSSSDSRQARLTSPSENGVAPATTQNNSSRQKGRADGGLGTDKGSSRARSPVIAPRSATALEAKVARVQYLIKQRQYGQAVTMLQPLFVKPPDRWEPWFWMGTAQLGLGQLEEAEESFVEGLARDATVPQLWVQRALVSQQQGKFGEALEVLRQAELIAPQLPEVQLNLAYSLEVQGHIEPAVDHYHTFLALTEGNPAYYPARRKVLERVIRLEKT